jgi:hypothetical protein
MSTVLSGPPALLSGPRPVPPRYGILSVVTATDLEADEELRWGMGSSVWGYPADLPGHHNHCTTGTFRAKDTGTPSSRPDFGAFTAYLPVVCTSKGFDQSEMTDRAQAALDARIGFALEKQLVGDEAQLLGPSLGDGNADALGTHDPDEALARLENAIAATGQQGVIHADPATASAWSEKVRDDRGRLVTIANGTPVIAGPGYAGAANDGDDPDAGQGWAWATGPLIVRLGPRDIIPANMAQATDRETNTVTFRAERLAFVGWDTNLQAAVLVDRS